MPMISPDATLREPDASSEDALDASRAGPLALRGSALRSGAYVAGILLSLVSAPLLIRHLHKIEYGRYVTVSALVIIGIGLTEGGVNAVALRVYATYSGAERQRLLANLLGVRIALSAAGLAGAVAFAAVAGYGSDMVLGTLVLGFGMAVQVYQDLLNICLQADLRFGWVALMEFLRQMITATLVISLVVAGAHLLGFFFVAIPAGVIVVPLSIKLVRGRFPLRPAAHAGVIRPLLSETLWFGVAIALNSVYFRLTVVAMSLAATAAQTGYFAISFRVVELLIALPSLILGAAYPILTRAQRDADDERFHHATRRMFELAVLAGGWIAVCLELGAGFVVEVLAGSEGTHPAAAVLRIQGLAVMFTFIAVACAFPMLSLRRKRELLVANASGLVVTVVLTALLVPTIAARGAAIATVGAELTLALVTASSLMRARPGLRLPLSAVPVAVIAGAVSIGVGSLVGVHPLVEVLVASCVYFASLRLLGRFPPELGDALRGVRPRTLLP